MRRYACGSTSIGGTWVAGIQGLQVAGEDPHHHQPPGPPQRIPAAGRADRPGHRRVRGHRGDGVPLAVGDEVHQQPALRRQHEPQRPSGGQVLLGRLPQPTRRPAPSRTSRRSVGGRLVRHGGQPPSRPGPGHVRAAGRCRPWRRSRWTAGCGGAAPGRSAAASSRRAAGRWPGCAAAGARPAGAARPARMPGRRSAGPPSRSAAVADDPARSGTPTVTRTTGRVLVRYSASASPTACGSGRRSTRLPLPRIRICPDRQSTSSNRTAAASAVRSPSRASITSTARSRTPTAVSVSHPCDQGLDLPGGQRAGQARQPPVGHRRDRAGQRGPAPARSRAGTAAATAAR